jgi:butanol dehydrogenase
MKDFIFDLPTRISFGPANGNDFMEYVATKGSSIMLVVGGTSSKKYGYIDTVVAMCQEKGLTVSIVDNIEPNPHHSTINEAAIKHQNIHIDTILALGGGSVMDAAKGIAILLANDTSDIWEYCLGKTFSKAIPVACIPTTAATASEVTPYSVISNVEKRDKRAIAGSCIKPFATWLNPSFTLTLPPVVTQDGAADILSHIFENYFMGGSYSPLADNLAEATIRTVVKILPQILEDLEDYNTRGQMLLASTIGLSGFLTLGRAQGPFPLHAIEHAISGFYPDLAHGRGLAILFPAYFKWLVSKDRCTDRLIRLGKNIFIDKDSVAEITPITFIKYFTKWLEKNGLLNTLTEVGIAVEDYREIAESVIEINGKNGLMDIAGSANVDDIITILKLTEKNGETSLIQE